MKKLLCVFGLSLLISACGDETKQPVQHEDSMEKASVVDNETLKTNDASSNEKTENDVEPGKLDDSLKPEDKANDEIHQDNGETHQHAHHDHQNVNNDNVVPPREKHEVKRNGTKHTVMLPKPSRVAADKKTEHHQQPKPILEPTSAPSPIFVQEGFSIQKRDVLVYSPEEARLMEEPKRDLQEAEINYLKMQCRYPNMTNEERLNNHCY